MDAVEMVADAHECLALAPIAHRTQCKVLSQRGDIMSKKDFLRANEDASCAGKSLLELMWEELDETMDRLMVPGAAAETDKGQALGIAWCIALVTNPYHVNMEAIREEALERWEERNPEILCIHCGVVKGEEESAACPKRNGKKHKWDE